MNTVINSTIDLFSFIFEFLAKQTIYTAILFAIIFVITLLLKNKSSLWHYGLWAFIFVRLLLPSDLSIPGSARSLVELLPYMSNAVTSIDRIGPIKKTINVVTRHQPDIVSPEKTGNAIYSDTAESEKDSFPVLIILLSSLWITGCLAMAFVILKKSFRFNKIIKDSSEVIDDKLSVFLLDWQEMLKIRRKVCIVSSDEFLSPFTVGIFRPVIYIPSELVKTANADTLHSVIAHEMVHIKRLDALWINILNILHVIYFFNPIVWFAGRKMSRAREEICDSVVLQHEKISGREYGKSILNVLSYNLFGADLLELSPGFGDQKKNYEHRIKNIIKEKIMSKNKKIATVSVICLLGLFLIPLGSKYIVAEKKDEVVFENKTDEIQLLLPMNGHITALFGLGNHPLGEGKRFHRGIDIAAPNGTPIKAAASGIVRKAGWDGSQGYSVLLEHSSGYSTFYSHCHKVLVKDGQTVKSGYVIAKCGETGTSTGNHLHFEIRNNGEPVNPYPYIFPSESKKSEL